MSTNWKSYIGEEKDHKIEIQPFGSGKAQSISQSKLKKEKGERKQIKEIWKTTEMIVIIEAAENDQKRRKGNSVSPQTDKRWWAEQGEHFEGGMTPNKTEESSEEENQEYRKEARNNLKIPRESAN